MFDKHSQNPDRQNEKLKSTKLKPTMETPSSLLQQYRHDRRKLLEFILSSCLIKLDTTPLADKVELDTISVDYIIDCINEGRALDFSEASNKYAHEFRFPPTIDSPSESSYFLCSDPELSGSPPLRVPPKVELISNNTSLYSSDQLDPLLFNGIVDSGDEDRFRYVADADGPCQSIQDEYVPSLGLPTLPTGLSDVDLRETAYELLLTSMAYSGWQLHSFEEKRNDKKSRFLSRLKSKRERIHSQPQTTERHYELLEVIRAQMQISKAVDAFIKRRIMQFASSISCGQIDAARVSLELLNGICRYDFPSEKSYTQWKKRQANVLEELLFHSTNLATTEHLSIRSYLAIIKDCEEWDKRMSPSGRASVLQTIRKFSVKLLSVPEKFGISGETYYWTSSYHLNIRLYEKLLSSTFDVLDEGQLVEEVDTVLRLIRLSWATLGITPKMHHALYGWVLFQQFVETGETMLLDCTILEMEKALSTEDVDDMERAYMSSIICSIRINGSKVSLSLIDAICLSMSAWCDSKLQDYHQNFSNKTINFGRVLTLLTVLGMFAVDESGNIKLSKPDAATEIECSHLKGYIERSIQAACRRLSHAVDTSVKPNAERKHPLAELADKLAMIAERESNVFSPMMYSWCPEATVISSILLHRFYGERLNPFLDGVTHLSEDARSVLSAAAMLDHDLTLIYYSAIGEDKLHSCCRKNLEHYKIGEISGPLILDWVNGRHAHILEWTERAFDLEEWEPLSFQQRHAASVIEVFRILEETVDQFFSLKLPMDVIHLQSLLSVIFRSLETYLLKMGTQFVEKKHLFPVAPALTRYKETGISLIKKKSINCNYLEEGVIDKLKKLTVSKLCVKLNTLKYTEHAIDTLEDGIRKSWALARSQTPQIWDKETMGPSEDSSLKYSETVNGSFATFDTIRKIAANAVNTICDFMGARIVFWDLREPFLFSLYRGNVQIARLETSLPHFDSVLNHICSILSDSLREQVVLSICRASMDGYVWVLLEGGPSCAFSEIDIEFLQEDLDTLKDFFVVDGEGLPPAVVEKEAILAQQILHLYSLQPESVIGMLMDASEQVSTISDQRNPLSDQRNPGCWCVEDANTLLRVLCHKKNREASKFLKRQYQLPKSSDYEDTSLKETTISSALISDMLKRSTSIRWSEKGERSFRIIKKKILEATSEIAH